MVVSKFNYITTIRLFWHYLFGNGETIEIKIEDGCADKKWYAGYLSLGHFNYDSHEDVYDFNQGEWQQWLIDAGTPFKVIW